MMLHDTCMQHAQLHARAQLLHGTRTCTQAAEFWELGLEPFPVSAISGTGTGEMLEALVRSLPPPRDMAAVDASSAKPLAIAIVGRPNVGERGGGMDGRLS